MWEQNTKAHKTIMGSASDSKCINLNFNMANIDQYSLYKQKLF